MSMSGLRIWRRLRSAGRSRRCVTIRRRCGFLEYLTDERYPWVAICETQFGVRPVQVLDERNTIRHVVDYEGRPAGVR